MESRLYKLKYWGDLDAEGFAETKVGDGLIKVGCEVAWHRYNHVYVNLVLRVERGGIRINHPDVHFLNNKEIVKFRKPTVQKK